MPHAIFTIAAGDALTIENLSLGAKCGDTITHPRNLKAQQQLEK
jgi:hypothetical protein